MQQLSPHCEVVALVATSSRPQLLSNRSIPSILNQSTLPSRIVVVDDSPPEIFSQTQEAIATIDSSSKVELLRNRRTRGASGAWNSGLDHLLRTCKDPANVFVAILDDDDEWLPDHLRLCVKAAEEVQSDVVATAFQRIETDDKKFIVTPPVSLNRNDFLIGNPGIQGSNLFIRLSVLLEAGMFDERLPSCTDRDLCIRLSSLPDLRYTPIANVSVHHYACNDRDRLSTPRSDAKCKGLEKFYEKYQPIMSAEVRAAFLIRAHERFDWFPVDLQTEEQQENLTNNISEWLDSNEVVELVVGLIVDSDRCPQIRKLLGDLRDLSQTPGIINLNVVLLENSADFTSSPVMREIVEENRAIGLRIYFVDRDRHLRDTVAGFVENSEVLSGKKLGIAPARTVLQSYLYAFSKQRPGAIIWILDDDMRLDALVERAGHTTRQRSPIAEILSAAKKNGSIDIGIGPYTGAPPLPFSACIRVQMVDLDFNLRSLGSLLPHDPVPCCREHNTQLQSSHRDYYYDLSRNETDLLETPFRLKTVSSKESAVDAFWRIAKTAERIFAGEQIFRPLTFTDTFTFSPEDQSLPLQRGGNTFVFDPEALRDAPNPALLIGGRPVRRSDMVWSLLQSHIFGRCIRTLPLPVYHDRSCEKVNGLDVARIVDDIRGYALYSALQDVLRKKRIDLESKNPWFDSSEVERIAISAHKYLEERLAAFRLAFYRIRGLAKSTHAFLEEPTSVEICWLHGSELAGPRQLLIDFLLQTKEKYSDAVLKKISTEVAALSGECVTTFITGLQTQCCRHQLRMKDVTSLTAGFESEREAFARLVVHRLATPAGMLRKLGSGCEGVVLTDGEYVYKVFDYWKSKAPQRQWSFLASLVNSWPNVQALYPLKAFLQEESSALLIYPYETTEPYRGGFGSGLVRLMVECREHGIVCRNIHPQNLRTVGDKVRLIDYGSDIRPLTTDAEYEMMCQRAWLSWRWAHRSDLKEIMQKALTDRDLPELDGFDRFMSAINSTSVHNDYLKQIVDLVYEQTPERVVDYGCGKGDLSFALAQKGGEVIGYDPDSSLPTLWSKRWGKVPNNLSYTTKRDDLLASKPFDLVISTRVLCALANDDEYHAAISDLRCIVRTGGRVIIALCDPWFVGVKNTPESSRTHPERTVNLEQPFAWEKRIESGLILNERFRSRRQLLRDFAAVGLALEKEIEIPTVDLDRFETVSEVRIFVLKALPEISQVTLMIKCCFMEAETLALQVQHLVRQLETPRAFAERLLVVDSRENGFLRQYTTGNKNLLEDTCKKLIAEGWVDQVVYWPYDPVEIAKINQKWFGISSAASHASSGAQIASTLAGFDACSTPYVLQVDSDVMVCRSDSSHDYLDDMFFVFSANPEAITVAFNIAQRTDKPYTPRGQLGAWRVEVRAAMIHLNRFASNLPLPNSPEGDYLKLAWHRALDQKISSGGDCSWRGGDKRTFFIHPPNARKVDQDQWLAIMDRIEKAAIPEVQLGQVDLTGELSEWLSPKRSEPFIFIIGGRNVSPGRFRRCLDSLIRQKRNDWGAVIIDDASSPELAQFIEHSCKPFSDRITVLNIKERRGLLANMVWAINCVCCNPKSVILTLDADDALVGADVLDRIADAYSHGADVTVGSMLRTDKHVNYPVAFDNSRQKRGGNVWQHLRTFRKYLFDAIPDEMLRLDGNYIDLANDWAYMLPIVEMAQKPVFIPQPLYLYEPSGEGKGEDKAIREDVISRIIAKGHADASVERRSFCHDCV